MAYAVPTYLQPPVVRECYETAVAITPTDNAAIGPFAALYVGAAGNVALVPRNSVTPVVFVGVAAGTVLRVALQGVNATSTTASSLVGLG